MLEAELRLPVFKWLTMCGIPFRFEVPTTTGQVDIVGVQPDDSFNAFNWNGLAGIRQSARARILAMIHRTGCAGLSLEQVLNAYQGLTTPDIIHQHLGFLEQRGWLRRIGRSEASRRFVSQGLRSRPKLIAIELKLKRQKEVIDQAIRNFSFASESYVALPFEQANSLALRYRREITAAGIGILAVSGSRCIELLRPSVNTKTDLAEELRVLTLFRTINDSVHSTSSSLPHEQGSSQAPSHREWTGGHFPARMQ